MLSGCFTGIEGTKRITLSREDRRQTAPKPEDSFLSEIRGVPLTEWQPGRKFLVADAKASILIDALRNVSGDMDLNKGEILEFEELRNVRTPDGAMRATIIFSRGDDTFRYILKDSGNGEKTVISSAIPGLIDPEMIDKVRVKLGAGPYWTLTDLWNDKQGNRLKGLKFDKIYIDSVTPGGMVFPINISFHDEKGLTGNVEMSFNTTGKDSRDFASLFSFSDPRTLYPGISNEVWSHIQKSEVAEGMTKAECRISKGNPSDVYETHDYSKLLLLWVYPDASTLYFEDDILVRVRSL